jgi:hypothetical protein
MLDVIGREAFIFNDEGSIDEFQGQLKIGPEIWRKRG